METVGVVIPIYGDMDKWIPLAERAMRSVENQTIVPDVVHRVHAGSVGAARNGGGHTSYFLKEDGSLGHTDWLIFLDADDELHPNYIEAMLKGEGDIRYPSSLAVVDGVKPEGPGGLPVETNILKRNFFVIGAMVRRDLFEEVGGFDSKLEAMEDWDFWLKCYNAGADIQPCPDAIYYNYVVPDSRNQNKAAVERAARIIKKRYRL